jgi:predicted TIM-barrel fold metal-dependent hydrolase
MVQAVPKLRKIDADSHFFPPADFVDLASALPYLSPEALQMVERDVSVFTNPNARAGGFQATAAGKRLGGGAGAIGTRAPGGPVGHGVVADRAKLLPETGFDMQVLIPDGIYANPFGSPIAREAEPGMTHALCRAFNVATSKAQKEFPEQFIGTAVVPFRDVQESCEEARYAVQELGLKIICINGNWQGRNYDEIELYPFWKTVHDLGAVLYVHHNPFNCQVRDHVPSTYTLGWERMRRLHISNYLGFAFEYMVGMASLTLGGLLEEFPNLKFVFFEAGGSWLPWAMYTLDRVYGVEQQCARCTEKPSDLIRRSCFVAVEPDEGPLAAAISAIGSDNYVLGSDYPHPPSTYPNTAAGLEEMEGLSQEDKDKILGGNIQRLLGIN